MNEAYRIAHEATMRSAAKGKRNYDRRVRYTNLQLGDCVLVCNLSPKGGPGKLRAFWEEEIHVVVARKGDESPVYELRPRNLLLPCEHLPLENWRKLTQTTSAPKRTTKRVPPNESEDEMSNSDSDCDDELRVTVHQRSGRPETTNPNDPEPIQIEIDPVNEIDSSGEDIQQGIVQEDLEGVNEA